MPSEVLDQPLILPARRAVAGPLRLAARVFGTAVLVLAPFIFALALKPLAYGIWYQTEPVTAGLLACGAASFLALLLLDVAGCDLRHVWAHPVLRLFAAFVAWNALASAFQDFPGRSWFGTPESGEGIFAFLSLLGLAALAMALWPWRPARRAMAISCVISATGIGLLDALLPAGSPWRPELSAAYAGLIGPPVFMIVAGTARRPRWYLLLAGFAAALAPVAFSQNKTALVLVCAVGPALYFLLSSRWIGVIRPTRRRWICASAPLVALGLTIAGIAVCMVLPKWDALYSMRSRGLLALAAVQSIGDRLSSLVWGFGWGSYNDLLYQHTFLLWVRGYQNGVWNPNWEGVGAGGFHSHIDAFEAVLGGGLVSGLLYLLLFSGLVGFARRPMLPAGAVGWFLVTAALSAWYPFMLCFPFLAIAMAACLAPVNPPQPADTQRGWFRLAPVLAAGALAWSTLGTIQDARNGGRLLAALNRQDLRDGGDFAALREDHGRAGVYVWWCVLNDVWFIDSQLANGQPPTEGQAAWYLRLRQAVEQWTKQGRAGVRLEALTLALDDDLIAHHADDRLRAERANALAGWGEAVLRVLRFAPDRSDIAVPYLASLAGGHQMMKIMGFCEQVLVLAPHSPACRWYSGLAMLTDPETRADGLREMHAALAAGAAGVVPITPATREEVETQSANLPR